MGKNLCATIAESSRFLNNRTIDYCQISPNFPQFAALILASKALTISSQMHSGSLPDAGYDRYTPYSPHTKPSGRICLRVPVDRRFPLSVPLSYLHPAAATRFHPRWKGRGGRCRPAREWKFSLPVHPHLSDRPGSGKNPRPMNRCRKRTVEFMVTTDGGIWSGSTISARSSSSRNSSLPGKAFDGSDSSKALKPLQVLRCQYNLRFAVHFNLVQIPINWAFRKKVMPW